MHHPRPSRASAGPGSPPTDRKSGGEGKRGDLGGIGVQTCALPILGSRPLHVRRSIMSEAPDASPEALESIGWGGVPADDRARGARVAAEPERGFSPLPGGEPAVAIFGSARSAEGAPEYQAAREVARAVARMGFNVLTGGGPGVMEAASRGCREGGGLSLGLTIRLPKEQRTNRFVERECSFQYFFVRKLMFVKYSCAFLIFL